ncbi:DUF1194 domain-containing protein [Labrys sp. KNU-23]|uniref:DUF1194 domain-containing protein n=1 Tax=Labrys sp. KNU-23 TaxID=2789216 RepID=UPI00165C760A|nr:DUF1194 domain-containing protein [Labrys sp. KNU-23]
MRKLALFLAAMMVMPWAQPSSAAQLAVDIELVLAVDISFSMSDENLAIQAQGYAQAFRDPEIVAAISAGPLGQIAVSYVEWSDEQRIVVPWTLLRGRADAERFASRIMAASAKASTGTTYITGAIRFGTSMIEENDFAAMRRVIDISGNGENNMGEAPDRARDLAILRGITINGLPMPTWVDPRRLGGVPADIYYRDHVIGGPGAFLLKVDDPANVLRSIKSKLLREIAAN